MAGGSIANKVDLKAWFTAAVRCTKAAALSRLTVARRHFRDTPHATWYIVLYLVIAAGLWYRVDYVIEYNPVHEIWSDPQRHWEQGVDTLRDDPMSMTDPVMYQLYIGALAKLTFKKPPLVAFYTALLSLLVPWFWYRFFRELQPSKLTATAGGAVITWLPSWISIYGYFMQETLMLPLLGLALWMTWRCRRKQTLNSFLVMVLVWALAGLTRGVCIPLAAVAATWLWIVQGGKPAKAVYGAILLGVILGPLTWRSYQAMGIPSPHGVGQMNMIYAMSGKKELKMQYRRQGAVWYYGFQSPSLGAKPFEPLSDWESGREGRVHVYVNIDNEGRDWERAMDKISMDLRKYLWITGDNLALLFFSHSWPDSNRERLLGEINYQMRWLWAPLGLVCLIGIGVCWRSQRRRLLLPALLVTWFVVQGLVPLAVNEGRYRKPFEGLAIAQMVLLFGTCRRKQAVVPASSASETGGAGRPPSYPRYDYHPAPTGPARHRGYRRRFARRRGT